jgi:aldose 1-epimerase
VSALRPTGAQHVLRTDRAEAVVTEVGGALRSLRVDGRDLVVGFDADAVRPVYRGSILAPWPNRVGDGRWPWNGQEQQLPLNEPSRQNALHGLVSHTPFSLVGRDEHALSLRTTVWPQPGYPGLLDLTVRYSLDDDGLTWVLEAVNRGAAAVPYGCSVHPYLTVDGAPLDECVVRLEAGTVMDVDPERLLPVGTRPVRGTSFDLTGGRSLQGLALDHAFTDVAAGPDGIARAVLSGPSGHATVLEWEPAALPWVQVCTADRPEPDLHRAGLAVEPMSCPPDALRSGAGLVVLGPGEQHGAVWQLRAGSV